MGRTSPRSKARGRRSLWPPLAAAWPWDSAKECCCPKGDSSPRSTELPGNQATALASVGEELLVGTPSGAGCVEGLKVRWRVASGEGRLPHPWVTAILPMEGSVLIGTYGGGLTRRVGGMSDKGEWKPFAETAGLKVNTGCLVNAGGRVYAGSDGTGLFRLTLDGSRFENA